MLRSRYNHDAEVRTNRRASATAVIARRVALATAAFAVIVATIPGGAVDAQFITDHLASLGAEEIPRDVYLVRLAAALAVEGRLTGAAPLSGAAALQVISQVS